MSRWQMQMQMQVHMHMHMRMHMHSPLDVEAREAELASPLAIPPEQPAQSAHQLVEPQKRRAAGLARRRV